jgi:hypothetical protein
MAKHKGAKNEVASKETVAETVNAEVVAQTAEAPVAEVAKAEPAKSEAVTGAAVVAEAVKAETAKAETVKAELPVVEKVAEAVKAEAAKAETMVTETAGQVASFVKGRLELAQKQFGQLEAEAQKALQTLVSRGRESGREVLQKLNVSEQRLRENPAVQKLEKQATWVGGEVRQRLGGLQSRMVKVVGNVASQSQVQAINRELDRLTRKLDSLVSPKKPEQQPQQETPKA